jgi:hypothetical protein
MLLDSGVDQSLLNACGHDHESFNCLAQIFKPVCDSYSLDASTGFPSHTPVTTTGKRKGRPRHLDAAGCLGLVLMWCRTRGAISLSLLRIMFGLTQTVVFRWLKFGKRVLLHVLQDHPDAKMQKPADAEVLSCVDAISIQCRHAEKVWAACDGLKLSMQAAHQEDVTQNMLHNGWAHGHCASCIFVFAPDGKIHICSFNSPGCWHDSTQADHGGVHHKIAAVFEATGGKAVIDSAFSLGKRGHFVKSSQLDPSDAQELLKNRDATSALQ